MVHADPGPRAPETVASPAQEQFWWQARAWQTNLALCLLGTLLFLLSRHLIAEYDDYTIGLSGTSGWSVWCYGLASLLVLRGPTDRFTWRIILAVAVGCRLATLFADASLSTDVYRYVWDGIVQHAGISPYLYAPADPHLEFLRDAAEGNIYPAINRATYAHTIYPPFAQMLFWLITLISPTLTCMKTCMVLCEGVTLWSIVWLLRALGRPREQAILYAWCPLLIWEIAGSGHLDSAAMALIGCALVARFRRRPVLTGLFLALAVLTKLYPLVLVPALYMRRPKGQGIEWTMPVTLASTIVAGYALYASAGKLVFGFLGGYVQEEGMATGSRYFLLELLQTVPGFRRTPTSLFFLFSAAVFVAIMVWAWRTASPVRPSYPAVLGDGRANQVLSSAQPRSLFAPHEPAAFLPPTFALAAALMLLFSPHYPWYIAWLIPFFAVMPSLAGFAYILGFFYLYTTALAEPGPKMFLANEILYALLAAAIVGELAFRRWRSSRTDRAARGSHDAHRVATQNV